MAPHGEFQNHFLRALDPEDLSAVGAHLELIELPQRRRLADAHRSISHVYFLESGISSTTITLRDEPPVEISLNGVEGVTNLQALLGADRTGMDTFMQVGGAGFALEVATGARLMAERPGLARLGMLAACGAIAQIASTALANGRGSVSERLARWLLMCDDRVEGASLPLTHQYIAIMLGVRRPGVTIALRDLERRGLVTRRRGAVAVIDRPGLVEAARGFYGAAEVEQRRLMRLGGFDRAP